MLMFGSVCILEFFTPSHIIMAVLILSAWSPIAACGNEFQGVIMHLKKVPCDQFLNVVPFNFIECFILGKGWTGVSN